VREGEDGGAQPVSTELGAAVALEFRRVPEQDAGRAGRAATDLGGGHVLGHEEETARLLGRSAHGAYSPVARLGVWRDPEQNAGLLSRSVFGSVQVCMYVWDTRLRFFFNSLLFSMLSVL